MDEVNGVQIYLKEISRHRVLKREEEVALFERYHQGDVTAREEIIRCNLRLVVRMAQQYQNRGVCLADLIQEGNIGLMDVVERFDHTLGFRFSTYAAFWIRQALQVAVRKNGSLIRLPVRKSRQLGQLTEVVQEYLTLRGRTPSEEELAERLGISVEQVEELVRINRTTLSLETPVDDEGSVLQDRLADESYLIPSQQSMRKEMTSRVRNVLRSLPAREHSILSLRFGLGGHKPRSLRRISTQVGLSQEGVRRVEQRTLAKLSRAQYRQELVGLL